MFSVTAPGKRQVNHRCKAKKGWALAVRLLQGRALTGATAKPWSKLEESFTFASKNKVVAEMLEALHLLH